MSSLVSGNGPSITVHLLPLYFTRAPWLVGVRPPRSSSTPAFSSSSLNACIARIASLVGGLAASVRLVAIANIMTFMACLLVTRLVYPSDDRGASGSTTAMQIFLLSGSRSRAPNRLKQRPETAVSTRRHGDTEQRRLRIEPLI